VVQRLLEVFLYDQIQLHSYFISTFVLIVFTTKKFNDFSNNLFELKEEAINCAAKEKK
jgi:hypothetical protein